MRIDPFRRACAVMLVVAIAGFVLIGVGWSVVAGSALVAEQVPVVLITGVGGIALVVVGLGLLWVQLQRRNAATQREQLDELLRQAYGLAEHRQHRK